jgi:ABC-2 type transport system ATP-binding protein
LEIAISTQGLTKIYRSPISGRGVKALNELTLDIKRGETLAIIGPNGSGKTTTLKLLLGLIYPTYGKASILGEDISDMKARDKVGYLPEEPYFYDCFTGSELLDYYGKLFGLPSKVRRQRIAELLALVGLSERGQTPLREYSKGMRQRAGLAQALVNDPDILILDEPTSGLDPEGAYQMRRLIRELKQRGKTILLCSHFLAQVEDLCDRVAILNKGELRACGGLEELVGETRLIRVLASCPNPAAAAELRPMVDALEEKDNRLVLELQTESRLYPLIDCLKSHQGQILEIVRPRPSLEDLFIKLLQEGKE